MVILFFLLKFYQIILDRNFSRLFLNLNNYFRFNLMARCFSCTHISVSYCLSSATTQIPNSFKKPVSLTLSSSNKENSGHRKDIVYIQYSFAVNISSFHTITSQFLCRCLAIYLYCYKISVVFSFTDV